MACFVTFAEEEGKARAELYEDVVKSDPDYADYRLLLKDPPKIKEAAEPSNIIWENRQISKAERVTRSQIACAVMVVVLALSFAAVFFAQVKINALQDKYPEQNCEKIQSKYVGREEKFAEESWNEFIYNQVRDSKGKTAKYLGPLQCYCEKQDQERKAAKAGAALPLPA